MSNEARHRDIAALLARGIIRVKTQPLVAKAIESHMQDDKAHPASQPPRDESIRASEGSQDQVDSSTPTQHGGDQ